MSERVQQRLEDTILTLVTQMLGSFGELRPVVRGASMVPSIFPDDVLIVRPETARNACSGDVVLFFRDGLFCTHRVVGKIEEGGRISLLTCGDALSKNDPPVAEEEFLGLVAAVVRGPKRIEMGRPPVASERLLRWAVRRSPGVAKWTLRWHLLRTRLAGNARTGFATVRSTSLESV